MLDHYLKECRDYLFEHLLSKWRRFGLNPEQGYSYESLNHDWQINPLDRLRLLTQCRQLYTFSHAYLATNDKQWFEPLEGLFTFIVRNYYLNTADGTGKRWIFSLNDQLVVKDSHTDCYALAFVLLSFSYYFKATGNQKALKLMDETHIFLQNHMRSPAGGFLESFPSKGEIRRQNPHMHLLEGYLAAYEVSGKADYKAQIKQLLDLLSTHFFDAKNACLIEFFNDDWSAHAQEGHRVEPGHHFEWIWLLHQADRIFPDSNYLEIADALWNTACAFGFDPKGGIYNQIDAESGRVLDAEKRIWPITEYLKALCVHKAHDASTRQDVIHTLNFAFSHYLNKDGSWHEYLDADNRPKPHPLPGTSSYHIFLGLIEVLNWAQPKN
jgi:mannose-6-phosphate isomerase